MEHPNKEIMMEAIRLVKEKDKGDGHIIAAIIVKGDEIISKGITTVKEDKDPTKHGEINAIGNAAKKLNSHKLEGCWLYTTFEPCPMCASACIWARMEGIVYGANMDDRNEKYTQRVLIPCEEIIKNGYPKLKLYKNFMRNECKKLMK